MGSASCWTAYRPMTEVGLLLNKHPEGCAYRFSVPNVPTKDVLGRCAVRPRSACNVFTQLDRRAAGRHPLTRDHHDETHLDAMRQAVALGVANLAPKAESEIVAGKCSC